MKTYLAKTKTASVVAMSLVAVSALLSSSAKGVTLIDYNFNSLTTGSVNGQDGWSSANNAQVATTPLGGPGATLGLTNGLTTNSTFASKSFFSAGTLTSSNRIVLTFEVYQSTNPSIELYGIGASSNGAVFGIWNGTLVVREEYNGVDGSPIHQAVNSSNQNITINTGAWYSIQSVWDLSTRTATLSYKNLSAGDVNYTQAYFNAAQTQSAISIGTTTAVSTWNTTWLRVGASNNGIGYMDNLSAVSVPEPNTLALGMIGLGVLVVRAQRRRASSAA